MELFLGLRLAAHFPSVRAPPSAPPPPGEGDSSADDYSDDEAPAAHPAAKQARGSRAHAHVLYRMGTRMHGTSSTK